MNFIFLISNQEAFFIDMSYQQTTIFYAISDLADLSTSLGYRSICIIVDAFQF